MTELMFLEILKTAMQGGKIPSDTQISCEEMEEIIRLAELHRVLPLVFDTVYHVCPFDEAAQQEIRKRARMMVQHQTLREELFLTLYKTLNENGLNPVVVKGIVCRKLYKNPDLRFSSDEDLLISAQEAEAYDCVLRQAGMRKQHQGKEDNYETSYFSDEGLHIELHTSLFPSDSQYFEKWNSLFSTAQDSEECIQAGDCAIRTLLPSDHLVFLILHSLKHFVSSGVGIRQICDIILFAQRYAKDIDWDKVCTTLYGLGAEKYTAGIFAIGRKHLGFVAQSCNFPNKLMKLKTNYEALLKDILCAGVYGSSTMSRRHSAGITLDAVQGKKKSIFRRLFPGAKSLDGRYGYAQKRPYLLPIAWVHRLFTYALQIDKNNGNTPLEALQTGRERVELLRQFDLISEE